MTDRVLPAGDRAGGRAGRLDRSSALPLWAQLQADLRRRIDIGEFADAPFPGETRLALDYAVSRQTVRQALRQLRSDGVLVTERGRPPRLAADVTIDQPLGALYSLYASVEAAGLPQRSVVRALDIRRDPAAAGRLGLTRDADLLYLERLRLAGNEPLAVDSAWLPADLGRPLLDADFTHTALYIELAARCGIRLTGGQEQLRAIIPTAEQRHLLGIDEHTAALAVHRLGCLHGRPAELRHTVIRGDHFIVTAQFSTSTGYQFSPAPFRIPTEATTATDTAATAPLAAGSLPVTPSSTRESLS